MRKQVRYFIAAALAAFLAPSRAVEAKLGGFELADGYSGPFVKDVWSYDAGQSGAPFTPAQYNTGRWQELFGSGNASGDSQYVSQHGYGPGGANVPPGALAVRTLSPSTDGSYNQTLRYATGADDLGVAPTTPLTSAVITFDLCPGLTIQTAAGPDTVFNNVPAFSLSFGGTNAAPGATIGFTDHDPANFNRSLFFYNNGTTYQTQVVTWSGHFDRVTVSMDFVGQTFDVSLTADANFATPEFDAGNAPQVIATGAAMTSAVTTLDSLYFRTHTDPSTGATTAGLDKSFLDNFTFSVKAVPEPSAGVVLGACLLPLLARRRRRR